MSEPLHILHLIDKNRLTTGSVVQMMEAARGLVCRGHDVSVVSRPGGDLEEACAVAGISWLPLPFSGPIDLRSAVQLRRKLRSQPASLLHVHKGGPHAVALLASVGLGPNPVIVANRGVSFPLDSFNKWKYRHPRVGAVCCVAEAVREVVIRSGGLRPADVVTVHGGTDTTIFDPGRVDRRIVREELDLNNDLSLVGQASVRDWRGWRELLAAVAQIAAQRPGLRLLLVGCDAAKREKTRSIAKGLGIDDRLLTLPYRHDMPEVLAACDVVVDASWAGTGITGTIREAMALERPVVATDCGGNRELVVDGEVGLLVPPKHSQALAGALVRLLDDRELARRLGVAARRRVIEHFSTEKRVDRLEALYRRVLESTS